MDMPSDRKCKSWLVTREELRNISLNAAQSLKKDSYICLAHGYYTEANHKFKEPFQCLVHRSNPVREEFVGERLAF